MGRRSCGVEPGVQSNARTHRHRQAEQDGPCDRRGLAARRPIGLPHPAMVRPPDGVPAPASSATPPGSCVAPPPQRLPKRRQSWHLRPLPIRPAVCLWPPPVVVVRSPLGSHASVPIAAAWPARFADREPPACAAAASGPPHADSIPVGSIGTAVGCGPTAPTCHRRERLAPLGPARFRSERQSTVGRSGRNSVPPRSWARPFEPYCKLRCYWIRFSGLGASLVAAGKGAAKSRRASRAAVPTQRSATTPCAAAVGQSPTTSRPSRCRRGLSLIHISEPTRLGMISYA